MCNCVPTVEAAARFVTMAAMNDVKFTIRLGATELDDLKSLLTAPSAPSSKASEKQGTFKPVGRVVPRRYRDIFATETERAADLETL
jgi:hypothetical protein